MNEEIRGQALAAAMQICGAEGDENRVIATAKKFETYLIGAREPQVEMVAEDKRP